MTTSLRALRAPSTPAWHRHPEATEHVWGPPGRKSQPRWSPGMMRVKALGAAGQRGLERGRGHTLSWLFQTEMTEPRKAGPHPDTWLV